MSTATSNDAARPAIRPATSSNGLKPPSRRFGRSRAGSADLERMGGSESPSSPRRSSFDLRSEEDRKSPVGDTTSDTASRSGLSRLLSRRRRRKEEKRRLENSSQPTTPLSSDNASQSNGNLAVASYFNDSPTRDDPDTGTILTDDSEPEPYVLSFLLLFSFSAPLWMNAELEMIHLQVSRFHQLLHRPLYTTCFLFRQ